MFFTALEVAIAAAGVTAAPNAATLVRAIKKYFSGKSIAKIEIAAAEALSTLFVVVLARQRGGDKNDHVNIEVAAAAPHLQLFDADGAKVVQAHGEFGNIV